MSFYKKSELAERYGVNPRTVTRWIDLAREKKNELELINESGKFYISKNHKNQLIMEELAFRRRKYLNKNSHKVIRPASEFYEVYAEEQIQEILTEIDTDGEIPHKFTYFNEGAKMWDDYANQMLEHEAGNTLLGTIDLVELNLKYIDHLLQDCDSVNLIDVGVGNALPSRKIINHLLDQGKLNRYVAIDISPAMLKIAERNINTWFGDRFKDEGIATETYEFDISTEPFSAITAEPPGKVMNLVLLLGGTLSNFNTPRHALEVVRRSMQRNDILLYSLKLDSEKSRDQFNAVAPKAGEELPVHREYVMKLLGIDRSMYDIIVGYDEKERARSMRIKLKHALTIEAKVMGKTWKVELNKADTIVVWRAKHYSQFEVEKLFYDTGFNPLHKSRMKDSDFMLLAVNKRPMSGAY